jgi:hypothetical protein
MFFTTAEEHQLQQWVVEKLNAIKQSNSGVIAKLILSLVKEDKNKDELKDHCISELKTFLKNQTQTFVDELFCALKGSYIILLLFYHPFERFLIFCLIFVDN